MTRSFWHLNAIHFKEYFREPGILFWTLAFPAAMAWILGVAFSSDSAGAARVALVGGSEAPLQAENFHFIPTNSQQARRLQRQGRVVLILEKTGATWRAHFDPRNTEAELVFLKLDRALQSKADPSRRAVIEPVRTTQKGNRYVDFLVPGLLAMGVMNSCLWGTGWSLIELRMKKLLRRMVASPMLRSEFLLSFFASRLALAFVEAFILFGFAKFYFDFVVQGSWAAFVLLFVAGNVCFWGMGVLLSSRAASARTGNGLINFVSLPMTIVGGVFFSYHNFPEWIAGVLQYVPIALLADGLRSVANEGVGVAAVLPASGILAVVGGLCFLVGLRFYRWY